MHDIRWIRDNAAEFDKALNRRPLDDESKKQFASANLLAIFAHERAAGLDVSPNFVFSPYALLNSTSEGSGFDGFALNEQLNPKAA